MKVFEWKELLGKKQINKSIYGNIYNLRDQYAYKKFKAAKLDRATMREVKYLSELSHPNIIKLIGVYLSNSGRLRGIIVPLYPMDLHDWINNNRNYVTRLMPTDFPVNLKNMIMQIVAGLEYIHKNGIIHCDIKEKNIMIDSSNSNDLMLGNNLRLIIIDFGLSNETPTDVAFTPNYKPIEVLNGETYNKSADIWSLGCVILAMLIGEAPFFPDTGKAESQIKLIKKVLSLDLQEYIIDINIPIMRLFDFNPSTRITAQELLGAFGPQQNQVIKNKFKINNIRNFNNSKNIRNINTRASVLDCIMYVAGEQNIRDYNLYEICIYCFYIADRFMQDASDLQMRHIAEQTNEIAAAIVSLCLKFLYDIDTNPQIEAIEDIIFCELEFCMPTIIRLPEQSAKLICYLLFDCNSWNHVNYDDSIIKLSELPENEYQPIYSTATTNLENTITPTHTPFFYS